MDKQNSYARYIDKFNKSGTTSIKTNAPPGGKSSFSLSWGMDDVNVNNKEKRMKPEDDKENKSNQNLK